MNLRDLQASAHSHSQRLDKALATLALPLPNEVCKDLLTFLDMIARWNATYNLTAIKSSEEMLTHHLFDCLAVVPAIQSMINARLGSKDSESDRSASSEHTESNSCRRNTQLLDVGSGAGLPGLVFAMVMPQVNVTTIDAVAKKTAFQQHAVGALKLKNVLCLHKRIEDLKPDEQPDLITCRAYAPLKEFVNSVKHLTGPRTTLVAMKGRLDAADPLPEGDWISQIIKISVPDLSAQRHLVIMKRT